MRNSPDYFRKHGIQDQVAKGILCCGIPLAGLKSPLTPNRPSGGETALFTTTSRRSPDIVNRRGRRMPIGCLKGKSTAKPKPGAYRCEKCDAVSKKKETLCKPKKIKDKETGKKKK
jgi:hypothetical protein